MAPPQFLKTPKDIFGFGQVSIKQLAEETAAVNQSIGSLTSVLKAHVREEGQQAVGNAVSDLKKKMDGLTETIASIDSIGQKEESFPIGPVIVAVVAVLGITAGYDDLKLLAAEHGLSETMMGLILAAVTGGLVWLSSTM